MKLLLHILIVATLAFNVSTMTAQNTEETNANPHFTIALGYGPALANPICTPCGENNIITGSSFVGAVGFQLNKKFLFDFTPHIWHSKGKKDSQTARSGILIRVHYSPFKKHRLHFIGGIGYRNYDFTPDTAITISNNIKTLGSVFGKGPDFTLGIGYEYKINQKLSLIPALSSYVSFPGNLKVYDFRQLVINNKRASVLGELLFTLRFYPYLNWH